MTQQPFRVSVALLLQEYSLYENYCSKSIKFKNNLRIFLAILIKSVQLLILLLTNSNQQSILRINTELTPDFDKLLNDFDWVHLSNLHFSANTFGYWMTLFFKCMYSSRGFYF